MVDRHDALASNHGIANSHGDCRWLGSLENHLHLEILSLTHGAGTVAVVVTLEGSLDLHSVEHGVHPDVVLDDIPADDDSADNVQGTNTGNDQLFINNRSGGGAMPYWFMIMLLVFVSHRGKMRKLVVRLVE